MCKSLKIIKIINFVILINFYVYNFKIKDFILENNSLPQMVYVFYQYHYNCIFYSCK